MEDLNKLKKIFKNNIINLIKDNLIYDSKKLLEEYVNINGRDEEIIFLEGFVALLENNIDIAEKKMLQCHFLDNNNFDYNYNLGYLYNLKVDYINSYIYYKKAYELANNNDEKEEIKFILDKLNGLNDIKLYNEKLKEIENKYKKVTIVIPTYNQKEHLKEAINSCLQQNYPNLEIIIADDCSTDGTYEVMLEYYNYNNIKYITNKINLGAEKNTRNIIDNYVNSKYLMIFNHDDYLIDNNYIKKAINILEENENVSLVWANCIIRDEILNKEYSTNYKYKEIIDGKKYFLNYDTDEYKAITGSLTSIFNFEKLKRSNLRYKEIKIMDLFIYLNLMLIGDIAFISDCVAVYRVHENGISRNIPREFDLIAIEEFEKLKIDAINKEIFTEGELNKWVQYRVYKYIRWRFFNLWNTRNKKYAIELLIYISSNYKDAYEQILLDIN